MFKVSFQKSFTIVTVSESIFSIGFWYGPFSFLHVLAAGFSLTS
jgi:hypothetical protein